MADAKPLDALRDLIRVLRDEHLLREGDGAWRSGTARSFADGGRFGRTAATACLRPSRARAADAGAERLANISPPKIIPIGAKKP